MRCILLLHLLHYNHYLLHLVNFRLTFSRVVIIFESNYYHLMQAASYEEDGAHPIPESEESIWKNRKTQSAIRKSYAQLKCHALCAENTASIDLSMAIYAKNASNTLKLNRSQR